MEPLCANIYIPSKTIFLRASFLLLFAPLPIVPGGGQRGVRGDDRDVHVRGARQADASNDGAGAGALDVQVLARGETNE